MSQDPEVLVQPCCLAGVAGEEDCVEEVLLWAQLTSVQVTGSYITSLSFGFPVWELSSQHPSFVKRAPVGRSALQMDPLC